MKKAAKKTTIIYIVYQLALAVGLRAISGARLWSPVLWEYYIVYGTHWLVTPLALVLLAVWGAYRGMEALRMAAAVITPVQTLALLWGLLALVLKGVPAAYLPLLAMTAVTADFFVLAAVFAWCVRLCHPERSEGSPDVTGVLG